MSNDLFFEILPYQIHDAEQRLTFSYHCSEHGAFSESFSFPDIEGAIPLSDVPQDLLILASYIIGLSYYKIKAAPLIKGPATQNQASLAVIQKTYQEGMAEFFIRNRLAYPYPQQFDFSALDYDQKTKTLALDPRRSLCAFGGGKDSFVAADILKTENDLDVTPVSIVMSDFTSAKLNLANANGDQALRFIKRTLDPGIKTLPKDKSYNGHIPITAINSLILMIEACRTGIAHVVFANEASASEPTIQKGDIHANHQYSKSFDMECALQKAFEAIARSANTPMPSYYSILRPFSELWIAREFAKLGIHHAHVMSCNRNFSAANPLPDGERWCRACPKCAFSYLILSPFLSKEDRAVVFGEADFFDIPALIPFYKELLGLSEQKPWECVGTIDECRAALHLYHKNEAPGPTCITPLYEALRAALSEAELEGLIPSSLKHQGDESLPRGIKNRAT